MAQPVIATQPTSADVTERVAVVDAALALAGHEITDPVMRTLLEQVAHGEVTGDQAVAAMRRHVQG